MSAGSCSGPAAPAVVNATDDATAGTAAAAAATAPAAAATTAATAGAAVATAAAAAATAAAGAAADRAQALGVCSFQPFSPSLFGFLWVSARPLRVFSLPLGKQRQ